MKVTVKLFATLRKYLPPDATGGKAEVELPDGATVRQLVERLGIPQSAARLVMVDGEHCPELDTPLQDGQTVSIFPPVAGG